MQHTIIKNNIIMNDYNLMVRDRQHNINKHTHIHVYINIYKFIYFFKKR